MNVIDKKIAEAIYTAQAASDSGKGESFLTGHQARFGKHFGYFVKPECITDAINMINGAKRSKFTYYVACEPDQNGYSSVLVYFEFFYRNEKYQISFHTPVRKAGVLKRYIDKGTYTEWDGVIGGSRRAALLLKEIYGF